MNINEKIIRTKVGLLKLAEQLGNVSKACQIMGLSRDTFYRYKNAVAQGGVEALLDKSRRVPNLKNRIDEPIEKRVCELALDNPALGQLRVSNELRKEGLVISAGGVRSVWQRHQLQTFRLRLKALETKVAQEGIVLTEAQVSALERSSKMIWLQVKSIQLILDILVHKIPFMWALSRELVVSISKLLSIPIQRLLVANYTLPKRH